MAGEMDQARAHVSVAHPQAASDSDSNYGNKMGEWGENCLVA